MTTMDDLAETLRTETAAIDDIVNFVERGRRAQTAVGDVIRVVADPKWPLIIVISGGQTGVDQAGLRAAQACGYRTGGMAPKGWRTDEGPAPWLADYGLVEGAHYSYAPRTEWNVRNSTGTVWFGDEQSPGGRLTKLACLQKYRGIDYWLPNPSIDELRTWIIAQRINTLNVAGNRERTNPGIGARTEAILRVALNRLTPPIGEPHAPSTR